ncbi:MAG: glucose-6-phosphate isomerase [Candidatus Hydromicrobium sp.]
MEEKKNRIKPFSFRIDLINKTISNPDSHIVRKLSSMKNQYLDETSYNEMIKKEDTVLYEVYEKLVPEIEGELIQGLSIVHPGKVGKEYFMTKGHFHLVLETAELYFCLNGYGYMIMETPEGDWSAKELLPYTALYIPGGWAHRSINAGNDDLVMLFVYPAHAGHNYATIETRGFRKLIVEDKGSPKIIENPRWEK